MGWPLLKIVWQKRFSIYFSTLMFMPVVSAIQTRIERHCSRTETVCLWLVDHSYDQDHAIKTLCWLRVYSWIV